MGCDTCQSTKRSKKINGKFPAKLADETPWNKICADLISPYQIYRKVKDPLILKYFTILYPVTEWFEIK